MSLARSALAYRTGLSSTLSNTSQCWQHKFHLQYVDFVYHEHIKYIEVDYHYIRKVFGEKLITLPHVTSDLQTADSLTKALLWVKHQFLVIKLPLVDSPTSIWAGILM